MLITGMTSVAAFAQSGQTLSFINGYNLQVTATSTNSYSGTNTFAKGYTITNSAAYPPVSAYSPIWKTNTQAFSDVTLWADRDGTPPNVNITVRIKGLNANFTNTGTFRFASISALSMSSDYPPGTFIPCTSSNGQFAFTVTGNGTNDVVFPTNAPSYLLQGSRALRLTGVEWSNAGTDGTIVGAWLDGYKPAGAE